MATRRRAALWLTVVCTARSAELTAPPSALDFAEVKPHGNVVMRREGPGEPSKSSGDQVFHYDLRLPVEEGVFGASLAAVGEHEGSGAHLLLTSLGARDDVSFAMILNDQLPPLEQETGSGTCTTDITIGSGAAQSEAGDVRVCNMPKTRSSLMPGTYACTGNTDQSGLQDDVLKVLYSVCQSTESLTRLVHIQLPEEGATSETQQLLFAQVQGLRRVLPPEVELVTDEVSMGLHPTLEAAGLQVRLPDVRMRYVRTAGQAPARSCKCVDPDNSLQGTRGGMFGRAFTCTDFTLNGLCRGRCSKRGSFLLGRGSKGFPGCDGGTTAKFTPMAENSFKYCGWFRGAVRNRGGAFVANCFWSGGGWVEGSGNSAARRFASLVCPLPGTAPTPTVSPVKTEGQCPQWWFNCKGRSVYARDPVTNDDVGSTEVQYGRCTVDGSNGDYRLSLTMHNFLPGVRLPDCQSRDQASSESRSASSSRARDSPAPAPAVRQQASAQASTTGAATWASARSHRADSDGASTTGGFKWKAGGWAQGWR